MTDGPSERMIETLCVAQVMRLFGDSLTFFTPTTVQEANVGYDVAFDGGPDFSELLFQFKRLTQYGGLWGMELNPAQFHRLKRYKDGHAWYVVALFKSQEELERIAQGATPFDILDHYAAVEVGQFRLKRQVGHILFEKYAGFPEVAYFDNRSARTEAKPLRVSELVERLAEGRAGVQVGDSRSEDLAVSQLPRFMPQDWADVKQVFGNRDQPPTQLRWWR